MLIKIEHNIIKNIYIFSFLKFENQNFNQKKLIFHKRSITKNIIMSRNILF